MERIIYARPDGGVSIIVPAGTLEEARKDVPADASDVVECGAADIPADRTFRDAWVRDMTPGPMAATVDMAKARSIHMGRIREARNARLPNLDVSLSRAVGRSDQMEVQRIEAERQALRDLPQTFDLSGATTPDDLAALWPPVLS